MKPLLLLNLMIVGGLLIFTEGAQSEELCHLEKDIKASDIQYFQFSKTLDQAYKERNATVLSTCCVTEDQLGKLLCQLVAYLAEDRRGVEGFLKTFPHTEKEIRILWAADGIMSYAQKHNEPLPSIFSVNGPANTFIDELFSLVIKNNRLAVDRYFNLKTYADGDYAEYMDDQLFKLFKQHPEIVVGQWNNIKNYKKVISGFVDYLDSSELIEIERSIRSVCAFQGSQCVEIFDSLKKPAYPRT
ncbi:MAG TPA: hypothetical protein VJM76_03515 [Gammaproteobacteria bacterium]|nr:hypothetical protein [Gammaproteobacteria bacterium]